MMKFNKQETEWKHGYLIAIEKKKVIDSLDKVRYKVFYDVNSAFRWHQEGDI